MPPLWSHCSRARRFACFLRNSRGKTASGTCEKGAYSLRHATPWLICKRDGGGIPEGRAVWLVSLPVPDRASRIAGSKGKFLQCWLHSADTEPSHDKTLFGGSR